MKRPNFQEHIDPEYQRWARKYPRFPGVAECARLIRTRKAKGAWADIIVGELARHAHLNMLDLIELFRTAKHHQVRLLAMMALEIAQLPESVPFFSAVLRERDPNFLPYAERGLQAIDTPEARTALWQATHGTSD